ncbi:hypothetical protein [Roseovarius spongiae]|nr:hypothetical protein [Roseovarius spongiae]
MRYSSILALMLLSSNLQAQDLATLSLVTSEESGAYIVGPDGRPVYAMLSADSVGGDGLDSLDSCAQSCRDNWPLLTAQEDISVGEGVNPDLIGRTASDGQQVLTYADQPLFQYHQDVAGGEPQGDGIYSFGGYWALMAPSGRPIRSGTVPAADNIPEAQSGADENESLPLPPVSK